jgi:ubiquitin carboxyl-terminal hydrolase 7
VAKNGTISDLLQELKKKANLDERKLASIQIIAVQSGRIQKVLGLDYPVASISDYIQLFALRIPEEDLDVTEDYRPINTFHFDKDPAKVHGVPFTFYLKRVGPPPPSRGVLVARILIRCSGRDSQRYQGPIIEANRHQREAV